MHHLEIVRLLETTNALLSVLVVVVGLIGIYLIMTRLYGE